MADLTGFGKTYGFSPETPTPVRIDNAVAVTSTRVRVTFSVEMKHTNPGDIEDVLNLSNWSFSIVTPGANPINPTGTVSLVQAAPTIVDIDTDDEMTDGDTYEVHVVNVRSIEGSGLIIGGGDRQFTGTGEKPTVVSATSPASFKVKVTFSEAMKNNAALTTPGNYTFVGPTTLNSASVLRLNATQVQITTAEEMQGGGSYTVEVNNVEDEAGNPIDTLANTAIFSGYGSNPRVLSAASTGPNKVQVTFSEAMDTASATDHTNYSIESGGLPLAVTGASQIHSALYELTTAEQELDRIYTLTVSSSVEDQVGNPVLPPYHQKNFAGIGKTFPIITFTPADGIVDVDPAEFFEVHVVDDARYFSGIDIDSVQISLEYDLAGGTLTPDIVVDGDFNSLVDGERSGEADTTIGLTYRFRLPGGWHADTAFLITAEATDIDGYTTTASATVTTGAGYSPCSMDHLWKLVPERMREMDVDEENVLRSFVDIMRHVFSDICERITLFPNLRDPLSVRSSHDENETVHIVSHTLGEDIVTLRMDDADDLSRVSKGWILLDEADGEFKVVAVRKRVPGLPTDYQVPEIDIDGLVPPTYTPTTGEQTLRPQSMIDYLAGDYGLDVDKNEPEGFQRSTIHNALQYLDLKGTVEAYRVRGLISGFEVGVFGLWYVSDDMIGSLPPGSFWLNPADDNYYTNTPPTMANYDEIPGDLIPADQFCWEDPSDYVFDMAPITAAWIGGASIYLWTADGIQVQHSETSKPHQRVQMANLEQGWAVGADTLLGSALIQEWDGEDWSTISNPSGINATRWLTLDVLSEDEYWVGATGGLTTPPEVFRWLRGTGWSSNLASGVSNNTTIWGSWFDGVEMWFVGRRLTSGVVLSGSGTVLERAFSPVGSRYFFGVWGSADNNVVVVGSFSSLLPGTQGYVYRWNGVTFTQELNGSVDLGGFQTVRAVWGIDADNIWAVGNSSLVLYYNGTSWAKQSLPVAGVTLYDVWGKADNDMYCVGSLGSTNYIFWWNGATWSEVYSGTGSDYFRSIRGV